MLRVRGVGEHNGGALADTTSAGLSKRMEGIVDRLLVRYAHRRRRGRRWTVVVIGRQLFGGLPRHTLHWMQWCARHLSLLCKQVLILVDYHRRQPTVYHAPIWNTQGRRTETTSVQVPSVLEDRSLTLPQFTFGSASNNRHQLSYRFLHVHIFYVPNISTNKQKQHFFTRFIASSIYSLKNAHLHYICLYEIDILCEMPKKESSILKKTLIMTIILIKNLQSKWYCLYYYYYYVWFTVECKTYVSSLPHNINIFIRLCAIVRSRQVCAPYNCIFVRFTCFHCRWYVVCIELSLYFN